MKAIIGYGIVKDIVKDTPANIWNRFKDIAGISKKNYLEYYSDSTIATGILFSGVNTLNENFTLKNVKTVLPKFYPPQSFAYLTVDEILSTYRHLAVF